MVQQLAWVFGAVFIVVGVLGFVPGVTADGHLLGIFAVDALHNVIHLLSGIAAIVAAWMSASYAKLFFRAFGVVYLAVTVLGFVMGESILGLFVVNMADNLLHLVIAAATLYIGFFMKLDMSAPAAPMSAPQQ